MSPTPEQLKEKGAVSFEMISPDRIDQVICEPIRLLIGRVSERWFGDVHSLEWKGLLVECSEETRCLSVVHPLVRVPGGDCFVLASNLFQKAFPVCKEEYLEGDEWSVNWGGDIGSLSYLSGEETLSKFKRIYGKYIFFPENEVDKHWIHRICGGNGVIVENLRAALNNASGGGLEDIGPEP